MKRILFAVAFLPLLSIAQKKVSKKVTPKKAVVSAPVASKADNEFYLDGTVSGFADGASVTLLNVQTGQPDFQGIVKGGKFQLKGALSEPILKVISFNNAPPYLPLMVEPAIMSFTGKNGELEKAVITGGKEQAAFLDYQSKLSAYDQQLNGQAGFTSFEQIDAANTALEKYIKENPNTYFTAFALIRYQQAFADNIKTKELFGKLTPAVQNSVFGKFIPQLTAETGNYPMGKPLADFSQADENGKMISLSSLRGKYVLIDFWASWCRPCRMENPNVVSAFNKYKAKNFTVFGVSLDKDKNAWLEAIRADNLTWQHVSDLKFWENEVAKKFGIGSIPQNILIDPNGIVVGTNLRGMMLDYKLSKILL